MYKLHVPRRVWAQIEEVTAYTEKRFGPRKRREYEELIEDALSALATDPSIGKQRPRARPDALAHHIKQRGRNARHLFFYRVVTETRVVQILAFLHDSMDFDRHIP